MSQPKPAVPFTYKSAMNEKNFYGQRFPVGMTIKKGRSTLVPAFINLCFRVLFFENEDNFQPHPIFNDLTLLHRYPKFDHTHSGDAP